MSTNLRIVGGRLRGKKLHSLPGTLTRPTADRVREAVFNILSSAVSDARVLDLFAGTGLLGLEALSRGAVQAVFVDKHRPAISVINKNILACRLEAATQVLRRDLRHGFNRLQDGMARFHLVFMDPPYNQGLVAPTIENLHTGGMLEKDAIVVVEHTPKEPMGKDLGPFEREDQRKYGKTLVSFLRYAI